MRALLLSLVVLVPLLADRSGVILSRYSEKDFELTADPEEPHWKNVTGVLAEGDRYGKPVPGHRTEIRSRWTAGNVYFLFVCPYEELYLKENPSTTTETNQLWNWDVAEVFVGSDFERIWQYKEFQVSPQGEWVDLDIDRKNPLPEAGWRWNAPGFAVKARIDATKKIWYGEMRIPITSIDARPPKEGLEMRINFYRIQGPPSNKKHIAWQPVHAPSYHTPERFGRIRLVK
jgi:hypothetical protein